MTAVLVAASVLSTLFAAIAATAALKSIGQAREFHEQDVRDRERALAADVEEFDREMDERRAALAAEQRSRSLEQLAKISELVAVVRDAARNEFPDGPIGGLQFTNRPTFWQARLQLRLGLSTYEALTGRELASCDELATGSTLTHVDRVIGVATTAFEDLVCEVDAFAATPD